MELYQLRAFAAVARHGNFTRAAQELHLSQPTVSGQIKALEEQFGVALFVRKAGGVELSDAGAELRPRIERLLADAAGVASHARHLQQQLLLHRTLRLGTVIDARFIRVGNLLSVMRAEHPRIGIETHHGLSGWVMDSVAAGELDCGFFVGRIKRADIAATQLTSITYRIVAPIAWADEIAGADWKAIAAMPWIWAPEQGSYPHIADEMFREHGVEPRKVAVADREPTIINLVSSGVGLALLRDGVAMQAAASGEMVVWEPGSRQAPLSFIHLESSRDDPALAAVKDAVRRIWTPAESAG